MISSLKPTSKKGGKGMTTNQIFNIAEGQEVETVDLEFLERMDFKEIEQMDPSCRNDFHPVFTQVIPCHMELDFNTSSHYMQTAEQMTFRILVHGEEQRPWSIRFQLTTEADVQLFYQCTIAHEDYQNIQMENDLSVDFDGFIGMVKSLLQDCVANPMIYQAMFTMENDDGFAYFRFFHNSEYRKSQILQLAFKQLDDEELNDQISYRINSAEQKAAMIAARIQDINKIIQKAVDVAAEEQGLSFDANLLLL